MIMCNNHLITRNIINKETVEYKFKMFWKPGL